MLVVKGTTIDGKQVVAGLFRLYETEGIPLELVFQAAMDRNLIPCWISFYKEALEAGMKHKAVLAKLELAIDDSYGNELSQHVISNLKKIFSAGTKRALNETPSVDSNKTGI